MKNQRLTDQEFKQLMAALKHMRESELERLLELVQSLVQELRCVSRHDDQSPAAAVTAQRLLQAWNAEVQRILKMQQANDAA
ncbi:MAG: hypothetical protein GC179_09285 [Anaerolineaceae bacterium]|nr:hypothetical protein [Anaerolineaceae bacterium]